MSNSYIWIPLFLLFHTELLDNLGYCSKWHSDIKYWNQFSIDTLIGMKLSPFKTSLFLYDRLPRGYCISSLKKTLILMNKESSCIIYHTLYNILKQFSSEFILKYHSNIWTTILHCVIFGRWTENVILITVTI